jgi:ABC-type phosphate transport system auxiliary subunit
LDDQFTKSFRLGTYKEHRERVLLDRERARLPESQLDAEAMKAAIEDSGTLDSEIRKLERRLRALETRKRQNQMQRRRSVASGANSFVHVLQMGVADF